MIYVAREGIDEKFIRILFGKSEGQRLVVTSGHKLNNNIRTDLEIYEIMMYDGFSSLRKVTCGGVCRTRQLTSV